MVLQLQRVVKLIRRNITYKERKLIIPLYKGVVAMLTLNCCFCRSIYEKHKLLFSTMLCLNIQEDVGYFMEEELSLLLQGYILFSSYIQTISIYLQLNGI